MTPADNPEQGTGVELAAQAFESLLSGNAGKQPPEEEQDDEAPAEAEALKADEPEEDAAPDEGEDEGEDAADQDAEDGEVEEDLNKLVTVTIDGKTEQVPLREAIAGYQRQLDYTRKTSQLADERRSFAEEREAVKVERAQYGQLVGALQQQLQAMQTAEQPDWERLYAEDPIEWMRQRENWRDMQERMQATSYEVQRVQAAQAAEQQRALSELVEQNRQKLLEAMPQWTSKERWDADKAKIKEYGQSIGFSSQELGQVYDHRAVSVLWKAMRYDQMLAKRPQPTKGKAPPATPIGTAPQPSRPTNDVTRAKQRLAKTGKVADAAALFEKFI